MDDSLSDLLRDYKLRTRFEKPHTIHVFDDPDAPPSSPQRLEHWKKSRTLGHGGQGRVVLQTCTGGSRGYTQRAVKMITLQDDRRRRYLRELEIIIKFSHDRYAKHFAKTMGWYSSERTLYIAMEYFPAGDLQTYSLKYAPLPEDECREISSQILRGLATMHQEGFAHRDVKPQNVLIQQSPQSVPSASWWVKLADFGISKRLEPETSGSSRRIGTLQYMAPELLRSGQANGSSFNYQAVDMWALGVTTFFVLTKTLPFQDISTAIDYASDLSMPFPGAALDDCHASMDARDFVCALMKPNPTERLASSNAICHKWIHSNPPVLHTNSAQSGSSQSSSRSGSFDDLTSDGMGPTNLSRPRYSKSWSHEAIESAKPVSETQAFDWDELESQDWEIDSISPSSKNGAYSTTQHGKKEIPEAPANPSAREVVLLEGKSKDFDVSLPAALSINNLARVRELIESGLDLESTDSFGLTALSTAASLGFVDMVKLLIEKGANLHHRDAWGETPLSRAARRDGLIVRLLLKGGADIETKTSQGDTPLLIASRKGDMGMARLLIDEGANIETKNYKGETPLFEAVVSGHEDTVKLLTSRGAKLDERNHDNDPPLHKAVLSGHTSIIRHLVEKGVDIDIKDGTNYTPLMKAVLMGNEALARCLIELGANLEARDTSGERALGKAAYMGHESIAKLLWENGAGLEKRDRFGNTPLMGAARRGHEDVVRFLLDKGADIDAVNNFREGPLGMAVRNQHEAVEKILSNEADRRRV